MVFSSIEFLFYFLPFSVLVYFVVPKAAKNSVLLLASLIFYIWGGGKLVFLLLGSIALNYCCGLLVAAGRKRLGLWLSVGGSLGLLAYFKYANFFAEQVNALRELNGGEPVRWLEVALPIGISFYTFQAISYVVDVARGDAKVLRNPLDFALFVAMFPQLVAGPIVRYRTVAQSLVERHTSLVDYAEGAQRFCWGLFKKVAIADSVAQIANASFSLNQASLTPTAAWIGIIAYTLQIYFDFSGYSDMAIGLGRIFGFRFPENFNRPYSAGTVTAFWRRWHMTLSNWFRDYLYIPLGGSRMSAWRTYSHLWIVFLATGFWHGAQWTFVLWGVYHGALLIVERLVGWRDENETGVLGRAITLFLVILGWVAFRADNFAHAWTYYGAMFDISSFSGEPMPWVMSRVLTNRNMIVMVLACAVFFLPRTLNGFRLFEKPGWKGVAWQSGLILLCLPYALMLVISGAFTAFIYFQF